MRTSISTANGRQNCVDRKRADRNSIACAPNKRSRDTCGFVNNRVLGGRGSGAINIITVVYITERFLSVGRVKRINRPIWPTGGPASSTDYGRVSPPPLSSLASGSSVPFSVLCRFTSIVQDDTWSTGALTTRPGGEPRVNSVFRLVRTRIGNRRGKYLGANTTAERDRVTERANSGTERVREKWRAIAVAAKTLGERISLFHAEKGE